MSDCDLLFVGLESADHAHNGFRNSTTPCWEYMIRFEAAEAETSRGFQTKPLFCSGVGNEC